MGMAAACLALVLRVDDCGLSRDFGDNLYNAIRLRNEKILDEEAFEYIARSFCAFCATQAGRVWWESEYAELAPETLKRFVESRITN